jgi:hypothetical protein
MTPPPISVLYIAGAPRSGSTLLDRLIGMQEGFCSAGELHFIWERSFVENQLCGCGLPFHQCAFWRDVSCRAFDAEPALFDGDRARRLKASLDRKRELPRLLLGGRLHRRETAFLDYGTLLRRLYGAILDVSGQQVVVDSSKDPRHGLILSRLEGFEVHVVHLVRDPRAVAFSWRRTRRRPEIHWTSQNMPIEPVSRTAARWTTHNALVELLARSAASYHRVRYEDLALSPDHTVSSILEPHAWSAPPSARDVSVGLAAAHTVAGNPMRFANGSLRIELDDEWRTAMPVRDRVSVAAATWPLLARYGYSVRGDT